MTDAESLMKRAQDLGPALRERASGTDELRRIPPETVEDFRSAELLKAVQPKKYGGLDLDYYVVFDIAVELGRASGSAAWCFAIWASHNWLVGTYPQQAQDEYWSGSLDTFSSTCFDPTGGKVTAVEGGYRLSGRWGFASGCDEATWVMLGAIGPAGPLLLLVPKPDFAVDDNWFVSGLRGTGSKDITVEGAFVPEHRVVALHDLGEGHSPGREVHDTVNYRFPLFTLFPYNLASPLVGMAQGVVDAFEEHTKRRISVFTGERVANFAGAQTRLAEAAAEVDAARLIMYRDDREVIALARNNQMPSLDDRARYRRNHGYVGKLCAQAATRLYQASGGHALFEDGDLPRFHRDVLAASHHAGLIWDVVAEQYGRVRLGLEPTDPFI